MLSFAPLVTHLPPAVAAQATSCDPEIMSVQPDGTPAAAGGFEPSMTPDGRFVAFTSRADGLVPGDNNAVTDVFLRDRQAGTTIMVSRGLHGAIGNGASVRPTITPDGRYVAFLSEASNLVDGDTNNTPDGFVRDLSTGVTERVSVDTTGGQLGVALEADNYDLPEPVSISDDGHLVSFTLPESQRRVALRDRRAKTTTILAPNSEDGALSGDGRWLVLASWEKLTADATTGFAVQPLYLYDVTTGQYRYIASGNNATINRDGRFVAYGGGRVWDRTTGQIETQPKPVGAESGIYLRTVMSPEGRFLAWASQTNYGQAAGHGAIWVVDRQTGLTTNAALRRDGLLSWGIRPAISGDGTTVAWSGPDGVVVSRVARIGVSQATQVYPSNSQDLLVFGANLDRVRSITTDPGVRIDSYRIDAPDKATVRVTVDRTARLGEHRLVLSGTGECPATVSFFVDAPLRVSDNGYTRAPYPGGSEQTGVSVYNIAPIPTRIERITIDGPDASDFRLVGGCAPGATLNPQQQCTVRLTFAPRAAGERRARIVVEHDRSSTPATATLQGHGDTPYTTPPGQPSSPATGGQSNAVPPYPASPPAPTATLPYAIAHHDGFARRFGPAPADFSLGVTPTLPVVGAAGTPGGTGLWLVASDGGIFSYGDARFYGSTGAIKLNKPIVGMAATPTGNGYWFVASDGGIFSFGGVNFLGSAAGRPGAGAPITSMAATPTGDGYWLLTGDGALFAYGDAGAAGSTAGRPGGGAVALVAL
jgi:Tol biopolymer transport system component